MRDETTAQIVKLAHVMRTIDALYLFRNEQINDHAKRVVLRYFFIQLDNLEKLSGRTKNLLFAEGRIDFQQKSSIEGATATLLSSYTNSFDLLRDKLAAHSQLLDLEPLLAWWHTIDYSVIELLYDEVKALESAFRASRCINFPPVGADYSPFATPQHGVLSSARDSPHIASDRLGLSKPYAISMISAHDSQDKAQLILSVVDFLEIDFALTLLADDPRTIYQKYVCDIAWLLAITDACSLVDNLFENSSYGGSLLSIWNSNGFKGSSRLEQLNQSRDALFESQIRGVRNRFAAHIEAHTEYDTLYEEYMALDISKLHAYVHEIVWGFHEACRADIRSKIFLIHGQTLPNVIGLKKNVRPFYDT